MKTQSRREQPVTIVLEDKIYRHHHAKFVILLHPYICSFLVLVCCAFSNLQAQKELPFNFGEELKYNIHFKYGIIMAKAGTADYRIQKSMFRKQPAVKTQLTFRTTSSFDRVFKIRDTLNTYLKMDLTPIHHKKYLHEGKTEYVEEMHYLKFSETYTQVRSVRIKESNIKFDTILFAHNEGHDLLNTFLFVRRIDYSNLQSGQSFEFVSFVGKDVVKMKMRYIGQAVIEKNDSEKYKTLKFNVDIIDDSFSESKNAIEIWVSDDLNHVPVKIKAKLKIGAAEVELSSVNNLLHPFDAKVKASR